ncbi:MAG: ribosome rescue protein RqcH [Candidatus Thorarchaeota archaeon]|nr:ribosome rescue protein RqcH [Candidatus Thorarchaeota archaeon]
MKSSMSNVDIRIILPELKETAEGAFIKNIYQYGDVFVLKLYQPTKGNSQLLIQPGSRSHLTEFRRVAPRVPSKFCTTLRKYLRDRRILSIKQHDLDRIIIFEVGDEESSHKLVAELFGNGNLLLLDPTDMIFVAKHYKRMRDRDVIPRAQYVFPPQRGVDVLTAEDYKLRELLVDSEANMVRTLSSRLNLDSQSCEEICALAGIASSRKADSLTEQDMDDLEAGLQKFVQKVKEGVTNPCILEDFNPEEDDDEYEPELVSFAPFEFEMFHELTSKCYDSFSQAIDEFFGVSETEQEDEVEQSTFTKEQMKLQKIIEKQEEGISILAEKAEKERVKGDLIYNQFQTVQEVLETVSGARTSGRPWSDIMKIIEEGKAKENATALMIERIIPSQAEIVVNLQDMQVSLDIRLNAQDNASKSYDVAKKSRAKIKGAEAQIAKTREKLDKLEASFVEPTAKKTPIKYRQKRWYEKFRWFYSTEGFLVLGGRDAKTNEQLAKRQMNANDVFLHASVHGAPYVVVKVPDKEPGQVTLEEAAQFAVTFSRAWQDGFSGGDAYWLSPEQVSFTPPSGEYLPSGSVMMYGTKNYIRNVPINLGVGLIIEDDQAIPMSGPIASVEAKCDVFVKVKPAEEKKGQLVKDISAALKRLLPEEQRYLVDQMQQEDIMRVLPPGGGKVVD